jgi:lysophospholipase L1-like esterase
VTAGAYATIVAVGLALFLLPPTPDPVGRYVAMGDLAAAGAETTTARPGYAQRLATRLRREADIPLFSNVADFSRTVGAVVSDGQLDGALELIADEESTTKVVTLGIGFGDGVSEACRSGVGSRTCTFEEDLTRLVRRLGEALDGEEGSRLLVLGLWQPFPDSVNRELIEDLLQGVDGRVDCAGEGTERGFNDVIACVAARQGATFVPTLAVIGRASERLLIGGEGTLPSAAGHVALAQALARGLDDPRSVRNAPNAARR